MKMEDIRFNEAEKEMYFNSLNEERVHYKKAVKNTFKRIEDYETTHGFVQEWTKNNILELYKYLREVKGVAVNTLLNTHTILKAYVDFYCNTNDGINHLSRITNKEIKDLFLEKSKTHSISYIKLHELLELLPNPSDQFILLGLFEGVMGKSSYCELAYASLENANYQTKEIWLVEVNESGDIVPGRKYVASEKLFQYAIKASNMYTYIYLDNQQKCTLCGNGIVKARAYNGEYVRQDVQTRKGIINVRIRSILNYLGLEHLSASHIYWSGVWYALQQAKVNHGCKNIDEVFKTKSYLKIKEQYNLSDRAADVRQTLRTRGYL